MGRKGKGREGKGKGIVIKAPGVWLGRGRYLKVCSMHAPSHFPYAHSYPQPPTSISDSPISHLHLRLPNYSHLQPPTRIDLHHGLACPLTQLQPLTATQPHSLHLHEQATHRKTHLKPLHSQSQTEPSDPRDAREPRDFTLLYQPYLTIPYQPYLGEISESFLSSPSPFPTISPYPITRVKE